MAAARLFDGFNVIGSKRFASELSTFILVLDPPKQGMGFLVCLQSPVRAHYGRDAPESAILSAAFLFVDIVSNAAATTNRR